MFFLNKKTIFKFILYIFIFFYCKKIFCETQSFPFYQEYQDFLEEFIETNSIQSVVDISSKNANYFLFLISNKIKYFSYPFENIIMKKDGNYSGLLGFPKISNDLPKADLLICTDILNRLSNEEILSFLSQCEKFPYCLMIHDVDPETFSSKNLDVRNDRPKTIDLSMPPFSVFGNKILTFSTGHSVKQVFLIWNTQ